VDAVIDVSFELKQDETLALVGESGSGKSSLARALIGLVPAASGSIYLEGRTLAGGGASAFNAERRNIALMFQDPVASLSPRKRVASLIAEPFAIHRVAPPGGVAVEVKRLLDVVGLPVSFASRYPRQLSGGQARRVGVA
jgi:ABC-type glutathione transport system ATPase component